VAVNAYLALDVVWRLNALHLAPWRSRIARLTSRVRNESPQIQNFIDGQFVEPTGGKYLENIEPATGKAYSQVADSDAQDVDLVVAATEKSFLTRSKKRRSNSLAFYCAWRI